MFSFDPEQLQKLTITVTKKQWDWLHREVGKTKKSKAAIVRKLISQAMKGGVSHAA